MHDGILDIIHRFSAQIVILEDYLLIGTLFQREALSVQPRLEETSVLESCKQNLVLARLGSVAVFHDCKQLLELFVVFETFNVNHNS